MKSLVIKEAVEAVDDVEFPWSPTFLCLLLSLTQFSMTLALIPKYLNDGIHIVCFKSPSYHLTVGTHRSRYKPYLVCLSLDSFCDIQCFSMY